MGNRAKFNIGDKVIVKNIPNKTWTVNAIHYGIINFYTLVTAGGEWFLGAEYEIEFANQKQDIQKFKPGDVVTVDGYVGQFEVIECTGYEPMVEDVVYKLTNIHTGEDVFGAETDMKFFGKKNEIKLEYNRFLVEKGKQMIDWYLDLYAFSKDEKYLRRIKRINNFINKIPVRAFQIED